MNSIPLDELKGLRVLVVDDDSSMLQTCSRILELEGYSATICRRGEEGRDHLLRGSYDISLIDYGMTGVSGPDLVRAALEGNPNHVAMAMSGEATLEGSVEARELGAWEYLSRPFTATQLKLAVGGAALEALRRRELADRGSPKKGKVVGGDLRVVGQAPEFLEALDLAERLAHTDASVFISGESGTGKDLIAHFIHERSRRARKPMLALNCAALPEALLEAEMFGHSKGAFTGAVQERIGLLESTDGGTLFLDEITEMDLSIQAKLLRVIQDGQVRRIGSNKVDATVDVRFIAATNRDPAEAVSSGMLRRDLYYRLRVVPLHIPPLRERREDIPILANHFLQRSWARHRAGDGGAPELGDAAIEHLLSRPWMGNVRELQNAVEYAAILSEPEVELTSASFPTEGELGVAESNGSMASKSFSRQRKYHDARQDLTDDFERRYLRWVVREAGGNMSKAARIADVDRTTLYRLMEKHDLTITREVQDGDD